MADETFFIARPKDREYKYPYEDHPPPSNPVLRGLPLAVAASIISNSPFLQRLFWANAGFDSIRTLPALKGIEPRYDSTVVLSSPSVLGNSSHSKDRSPAANLSAPSEHQQFLVKEDFSSKAPPNRTFYSVLDYHEAYKSGRVTPLDVVEGLLPLIRRSKDGKEEGGKHAVAFLESKVEVVRRAAEESGQRWKEGKVRGVLDGVPMAIKDEEDLTDYPKCTGSKLDFSSPSNSTSFCVARLQAAGAICIGKTTMHELGLDTTNNNPWFGTPRNPYHAGFYTGGSSGGSAYAVASGLVPFAVGNDGGGSIRIPANYCGVYGLKTSAGRVSIRPTANLARSNGVCGPIAGNMVDVEVGYRVMAEPDQFDGDGGLWVPPGSSSKDGPRKKTLGVFKAWFDRADSPVKEACMKAVDYLTSKLGYEVVDIEIPLLHEGQLAHAMTILAEISSSITPSSIPSLTAPNKILLSVGSSTPSPSFLAAQQLRHLLMQHLAHLYTQHPGLIILTPTTPNAGWKIDERDAKYGCSDGNTSIRSMEYVWLGNFTGCPGLSAPVGYVREGGKEEGVVPIGLMGVGEWGSEEELIAFGYDVERYLHEGLEGGRKRPGNFVDGIIEK